MHLYNSGYFNLTYDPAHDVLQAALPDMITDGLSEAEHCFAILVDHVKNYQVQNLLLDSSNARVNVNQASYHQLIYQVSTDLKKTNLKKVARLVSRNSTLETMAVAVQHHVLTDTPTYQIRNFSCRTEAMNWLTERPLD